MFTGIDTVTVIPRRRWTAVASFTVQAAVVAAALVLPLWRPTGLPEAFSRRHIFVPPSEPEIPVPTVNEHSHIGTGGPGLPFRPIIVNRDNGVHFGPARPVATSNEAPPDFRPSGPSGTGLNFGIGPGAGVHPILQKPTVVSVMMLGNLVHRVEPLYPVIARSTGVQGTVVVKALISSDGRIEQAQVISGSPLLSPAALEAIKQWKYRPYILNGKPIEVETEITVNFVLSR